MTSLKASPRLHTGPARFIAGPRPCPFSSRHPPSSPTTIGTSLVRCAPPPHKLALLTMTLFFLHCIHQLPTLTFATATAPHRTNVSPLLDRLKRSDYDMAATGSMVLEDGHPQAASRDPQDPSAPNTRDAQDVATDLLPPFSGISHSQNVQQGSVPVGPSLQRVPANLTMSVQNGRTRGGSPSLPCGWRNVSASVVYSLRSWTCLNDGLCWPELPSDTPSSASKSPSVRRLSRWVPFFPGRSAACSLGSLGGRGRLRPAKLMR